MSGTNKWDQDYPELEFMSNHLSNLLDKLGEHFGSHFGVEMFCYSHSEHIQFGDEKSPKAPCVILTGPSVYPSENLSFGILTVDVDTNGAGQIQTRQYENIPHIDWEMEYMLICENPLQLAKFIGAAIILHRSNAFLKVDGRKYQIWRKFYPSSSNVINHTNMVMAKGQFCIKGIPIISRFDVLKSGRIYNVNIQNQN